MSSFISPNPFMTDTKETVENVIVYNYIKPLTLSDRSFQSFARPGGGRREAQTPGYQNSRSGEGGAL